MIGAIQRYTQPVLGDGVTKAFAYLWRIFAASDLKAYVAHTLQPALAYVVTGVGALGGTVVFNVAPPDGQEVQIFDASPTSQLHTYTEGGTFPAESHENGLDRGTAVDWQLRELLERRIGYGDPTVLPLLRNLEFPQPAASQLIGWNSTKDGLVNHPSAINQVSSLPDEGAVRRLQSPVHLLNTTDDVPQLITTGLVPDGAQLDQLMAAVTIEPGASRGLTGWNLGTVRAYQRFARGKALTVGTETTASEIVAYAVESSAGGLEAVITADAGHWDTVGQFAVTATYRIFVVPTS